MIEIGSSGGVSGVAPCRAAFAEQICALGFARLAGEDVSAVAALYELMQNSGLCEVPGDAIGTLDIALWDAKAKYEGVPLWRCLGGDGCPGRTLSHRADGYGAIVTLFGDVETDLKQIGVVHDDLSRQWVEPVLYLVAPEQWQMSQFIDYVRSIERHFDISFVEAPAKNASEYCALSNDLKAALCFGRGLTSPDDFRNHVQERALDAALLDIRTIGFSGAMQVADAVYMYELPVIMTSSYGNIAAHLAGALPYFAYAEVEETGGPWHSDISIVDGWAVPGVRLGHGLEFEP